MKNIMLVVIANLLLISSAIARDTVDSYSIDETMSLEKSKSVKRLANGYFCQQ